MQDKLISIIVPIYNVEQYLKKCIDSILAQTYENLEILLIDDGSPDNCGLICDEYEQQDKRIKVIHQHNGGLSAALNTGLDTATGEYIGFVDSDDWIEPNMYEHLMSVMDETGSDIVQCADYAHDNVSSSVALNPTNDFSLFSLSDFKSMLEYKVDNLIKVSKSLTLYKAAIFVGLRFSIGHYSQDVIAFPEIISRCKVFTKTDLRLYHRYKRINSISRQEKQLTHLKSHEKIIDTYFQVYKDRAELKDLVAFYLCRLISMPRRYFSLAESKNITKPDLKAHKAAICKVYRACYKDAQKNVRYERLSTKKRLYWRLFRFSPTITFQIIKTLESGR